MLLGMVGLVVSQYTCVPVEVVNLIPTGPEFVLFDGDVFQVVGGVSIGTPCVAPSGIYQACLPVNVAVGGTPAFFGNIFPLDDPDEEMRPYRGSGATVNTSSASWATKERL